ncbi:hypothetical protein [Gilliamella sp. B2894]|nr:hypothetical protein [Gilliamella sp. B2894]
MYGAISISNDVGLRRWYKGFAATKLGNCCKNRSAAGCCLLGKIA